MRHAALLLTALLAAGCSGDKGGGDKPLTADQQTQWRKKCQEIARRHEEAKWGKPFAVAGYVLKKESWEWQAAYVGEPVRLSADQEPNDVGGEQEADKMARDVAAVPGVVLSAVVDLYRDEPSVVRWYVNDGKETKAYDRCPRPDAEAALHAAVRRAQTSLP